MVDGKDRVEESSIDISMPYPLSLHNVLQNFNQYDDFLVLNQEATENSTTSRISTMLVEGERYYVKAIDPESWVCKEMYTYPTLKEKADAMNYLYRLYAEYLQDHIVSTAYFVERDSNGNEQLYCLQPEVKGQKFHLNPGDTDPRKQIIAEAFVNIREDKRYKILPENIKRHTYDWSFGVDGSIIETEDKRLVLIDW